MSERERHPGPGGAAGEGERASGVQVAPGVTVPAAALRFSYARSSGPGGQNVNKLATKAELRVSLADLPLSDRVRRRLATLAGKRLIGEEEAPAAVPSPPPSFTGAPASMGTPPGAGAARPAPTGEIVIVSQSERSQARNRAECMEKLRDLLIRAMAEPKVRRKTRPTRGSVERRIEAKKTRGETKRRRSSPGEG